MSRMQAASTRCSGPPSHPPNSEVFAPRFVIEMRPPESNSNRASMPGFPFTLHLGEHAALTSAVVPGLLYCGKPVNLHGVAVSLAPERRQHGSLRSRTLTLNAPYAGEMYRCRLKDVAFEHGLVFSGVHVPGDFAATVSVVTERHGTIFLRSLGPRLIHVLPESLPTKPSAGAAPATRRARLIETLRHMVPGITDAPMIPVDEIREVHVNYLARDGVDASLECSRLAIVASVLQFTTASGKLESAAMLPNPAAASLLRTAPQSAGGASRPATAVEKLAEPQAKEAQASGPKEGIPGPAAAEPAAGPAAGTAAGTAAEPAAGTAAGTAAEPAAASGDKLAFREEALAVLTAGLAGMWPALMTNAEYMAQLRAKCMITTSPTAGSRDEEQGNGLRGLPGRSAGDGCPSVDAYVQRVQEEQRIGHRRVILTHADVPAKPASLALPPVTYTDLTEAMLAAQSSIVPRQSLGSEAEVKRVPERFGWGAAERAGETEETPSEAKVSELPEAVRAADDCPSPFGGHSENQPLPLRG
jgi:hypothetical protein